MRRIAWITIYMLLLCTGMAYADYTYYVPYLRTQKGQLWTGLGIRNAESEDAFVRIDAYTTYGQNVETQAKAIPAQGQTAFLVTDGLSLSGWIKISSNKKLSGLAFAGSLAAPEYMYDIPFISQKCTNLLLPHNDDGTAWRTSIIVCNPNATATTATVAYRDANGNLEYKKSYLLQAMGSRAIAVRELVNNTTRPGGSVAVSASQAVCAFGLFSGLEANRPAVAGIAVDCLPPDEPTDSDYQKSKMLIGEWSLTSKDVFDKYFTTKFIMTDIDSKRSGNGVYIVRGMNNNGNPVVGTYDSVNSIWKMWYSTYAPFIFFYGISFSTDGNTIFPGACEDVWTPFGWINRCGNVTGSKTALHTNDPAPPEDGRPLPAPAMEEDLPDIP